MQSDNKQEEYLFLRSKYFKDPLDGKIKLKDYDKMIKEMYKTEGYYGLIKKNNQTIIILMK